MAASEQTANVLTMPPYLDGKIGNDAALAGVPGSRAVLFTVTHTEKEANQGRGPVARHRDAKCAGGRRRGRAQRSDRHGDDGARRTTEQPEHGRFDQQLATQPTWRGAERGPHGQFATTVGSPGPVTDSPCTS